MVMDDYRFTFTWTRPWDIDLNGDPSYGREWAGAWPTKIRTPRDLEPEAPLCINPALLCINNEPAGQEQDVNDEEDGTGFEDREGDESAFEWGEEFEEAYENQCGDADEDTVEEEGSELEYKVEDEPEYDSDGDSSESSSNSGEDTESVGDELNEESDDDYNQESDSDTDDALSARVDARHPLKRDMLNTLPKTHVAPRGLKRKTTQPRRAQPPAKRQKQEDTRPKAFCLYQGCTSGYGAYKDRDRHMDSHFAARFQCATCKVKAHRKDVLTKKPKKCCKNPITLHNSVWLLAWPNSLAEPLIDDPLRTKWNDFQKEKSDSH